MAVVNTLIGNIKGPKGDTGATGATGAAGATGADATVSVGSTTTVPYGQAARVTNSGTPGAAVFNFTIPQGKPGEQTTKLDALTLDALTEPSTQFPVPAVGDNGSTLFGKISKWFSDMSALVATKLNVANVVNNLTTTASGYALDARQGKTLQDQITSLNDSLIKSVYIFSTTTASGNIDTGYNRESDNVTPIAAISPEFICIPWVHTDSKIYIKVLNPDAQMAPAANKPVGIRFMYVVRDWTNVGT